MKRQVNHARMPFLCRGGFAPLCLVALFLCQARVASATCGDYLAGHSGHSMAGHGMSGHVRANADFLLMPKSESGERRQQDRRPTCSGPRCQQRDSIPVAPSRILSLPQPSDALLADFDRFLDLDDGSIPNGRGDVSPVERPAGRLFRPPRAA